MCSIASLCGQDFCHGHVQSQNPGLAQLERFRVAYSYSCTLLGASWALVIVQAIVFMLMADNIRVARIAAADFFGVFGDRLTSHSVDGPDAERGR